MQFQELWRQWRWRSCHALADLVQAVAGHAKPHLHAPTRMAAYQAYQPLYIQPMKKMLWPLLWFGLFLSRPAWADDLLLPWRVCAGDLAIWPYLSGDASNSGLADKLLLAAGLQAGLAVELVHSPFKRCHAMFDVGKIDALIVADTSFNEKSLQFPLKDGIPDASRRVAHLKLVWVRRADSSPGWDGHQFVSRDDKPLVVGVRNTLYIGIFALRAHGYQVDDGGFSTPQVLAKLAFQRVDLAIGLQEEVERAMRDPDLNHLVVLPQALLSSDYFVVTHNHLGPDMQTHVERWWNAIGRLRETSEFRPH